MATDSKRDVRLGVEIETTGEEGLRRGAEGLRALARAGGDGADELLRFAAQLDQIADSQRAVGSLRDLTTQVEALAVNQREAAAATERYATELRDAQNAAAPLVARQRELQDSITQNQTAYRQAGLALRALRQDYTGADRDSLAFTSRQTELRQQLETLTVALGSNKRELQSLTPAVKAAESEERKLAAQYERAAENARLAGVALGQRNRQLDEAGAAARALGVATDDLAAAEQTLLANAQRVAQAVNAQAQAQREAAAVAATLADLDAQNARALEQRIALQRQAVETYERETTAVQRAEQASREKAAADAAAAQQLRLLAAAALQADNEFRSNVLSLRAAAQAADQLAASQADEAMRQLSAAAAAADAEFDKLVRSISGAEKAAEEYTAATERAAVATTDDTQALRARLLAAEQLIVAERTLTQGQRDLALQRNLSRAAILAEAQALTAQAAASRESQAATVAAAQAARQAGAAIESAFGATGVRSIQAIETEIEQTSQALVRLTSAARAGDVSIEDLSRAAGAAEVRIARLRAEILQVNTLPSTFDRVSNSVNDLVTRFGALTAAIATVGFAVAPAVRSFIQLESATRVLTTITGSATQAAAQIEFLRQTAQRSGQGFDALAVSYSKFAASALQTGLGLETTQQVFSSVALAAGNLGLSTDQAGRALEALSQIASKGVAGMEELRQQLGDALPGVLPLLAKELGLTTAELNKLVEQGQLTAREAIPAIGRALQTLGTEGGKPVEGLVADFNRLVNVVKETSATLAEGAIGRALGAVLSVVSLSVQGISVSIGGLGILITNLADRVSIVGAAITTLDFSQIKQAIADVDAEASEKFGNLVSRIGAGNEAGKLLAGSLRNVANEVKAATEALDGQGRSLARVAIDSQKVIDAAEEQTRSLTKNVDARKSEGEALVRNAGLLGNEVVLRDAQARAADLAAGAAAELAGAQDRLVASLQAGRTALIAQAQAQGLTTAEIQAAVDVYDKSITAKTADAEKSREQAEAARAAALGAKLQADAVRDTAGSYDVLREGVDAAQKAVNEVSRRFAEGKASSDQLREATDLLAIAKGKLKNALDDQEEASRRAIDALKAESEFTKAQIQLKITRLKLQAEELRSAGSLAAAKELLNQITDLELQLAERGTQAKRDEAVEIIRATTLRREALREQGLLTAALEIELNTRIRSQQAILLQTEAASLNEAQTRKNEEAARLAGVSVEEYTGALTRNSASTRDNTGATDSNTDSKRRNAEATRSAATAQKEYNDLLANTRALGGPDGNAGGIGEPNPLRGPGDGLTGRPPNQLVDERTAGGQINIPEGFTFDFEGYNAAVTNNRTRGVGAITVNPAQFLRRDQSITPGPNPSQGTPGGFGSGFAGPSQARPPVAVRYEVRLPDGSNLYADSSAQAEQFMDELSRSFRQFGGSAL